MFIELPNEDRTTVISQPQQPEATPAPTPRLAGVAAVTAVRAADGRLIVLPGGLAA